MYKILIIGYGSIAKKHHLILKKIKPASIFYILSKHQNLKNNSDKIIKDLKEVKEIKPNLILITTTTNQHLEYAIKCCEYSKEIFIEKPLSNKVSISKFRKLYKNAKKYKTNLNIGYNLRHLESLNYFFKLLKSLKFGKILSIDIQVGSNLKFWRKGINYKLSASAKKELGGGVLLELSHELDYVIKNFNLPTAVNGLLLNSNSLGIGVEDTAYIYMLNKNNSNILPITFKLDFIRSDKKRLISVYTKKNSLMLDLNSSKIYYYNTNKWKVFKTFKHKINDTYKIMWNKILKNNKHNNLEDFINYNFNLINLIDKIKKSSSKKKMINVSKIDIV